MTSDDVTLTSHTAGRGDAASRSACRRDLPGPQRDSSSPMGILTRSPGLRPPRLSEGPFPSTPPRHPPHPPAPDARSISHVDRSRVLTPQ